MNGRPGLSLLEVMVAVLIVGMSVTSLLILQGKLSRGVFTAHALIDRIPFIGSFFASADRDKLYLNKKQHKKMNDDPELTMTYSVSKPTSKPLASFSHLMVEKIDAQWPTVIGNRTETFAQLRCIPGKEKEKSS